MGKQVIVTPFLLSVFLPNLTLIARVRDFGSEPVIHCNACEVSGRAGVTNKWTN